MAAEKQKIGHYTARDYIKAVPVKECTDWFARDTRPKRKGWYAVKSEAHKHACRYWDGEQWMISEGSKDPNERSALQNWEWRGLMVNHKPRNIGSRYEMASEQVVVEAAAPRRAVSRRATH